MSIDPDNGILALVGGTFIADGAKLLPRAGDAEKAEPQRTATVDVPHLGQVVITYRLNTYRHGASRHWHWVAEHAARAVS